MAAASLLASQLARATLLVITQSTRSQRGNIINKLDLAFITQIHQSAMALADAGEQVRLRVEGAAFLERNSRQRLAPKVPDMLDQEFHSSSCALTLDDDVFLKRHSTRSAGLQIIDYPILLAM